jgi:predicted transposase YbfD/YdcC
MSEKVRLSLLEHFAEVPDPRMMRTRRHGLLDMLAMSVCAVIGGADCWTEVVSFARARREWFEKFLELPNGIPSHDTFARVFRLLDADALEGACVQWLRGVAGAVEGVVAIDGKSVRGSADGGRHPLHVVSAWAAQRGLLLGQVRTEEKSNEITAIPALLKLLSVKGCIVTIDAMGCQKVIAGEIRKAEADYVLSLKANHPTLHNDASLLLQVCVDNGFANREHAYHISEEGKCVHGRMERREHWVIEVPEHLRKKAAQWPGLQTLAMVRRHRQVGDKCSVEDSYYLSSLGLSAGAQVVADAVRSHWAVENALHWSLDVGFREDASQVCKDNAPANLAVIRRIAMTQIKQEQSLKLGVQGKRRTAGWDLDYLEKVLEMVRI